MTTETATPILSGRFSEAAARIADGLRRGVTVVRASRGGHGAGTVWRADGLVITNNHVAAGDHARVIFADGTEADAHVIARDPGVDLAALQVDTDGLAALPAGDSAALRVGQLVLAVGNPFGEMRAVTAGIISATGGGIAGGTLALREAVQANITLRPGNSGGPLADSEGRVIGINSMVLGPGVAIAVPANTVARFLAERAPGGAVLGIAGQPVELPGVDERAGVLVSEVVDGSAAEAAGLLPGDVLLTIDGTPTASGDALLRTITTRLPGEPRRLAILRGGVRREVTVIPRAREAA